MPEDAIASAVLADHARTVGVEGIPRDLALWASAQPGVLGALGIEALAEHAARCWHSDLHEQRSLAQATTLPCAPIASWSLSRARSGAWFRVRSRSGSRSGSEPGTWSRSRARSRMWGWPG